MQGSAKVNDVVRFWMCCDVLRCLSFGQPTAGGVGAPVDQVRWRIEHEPALCGCARGCAHADVHTRMWDMRMWDMRMWDMRMCTHGCGTCGCAHADVHTRMCTRTRMCPCRTAIHLAAREGCADILALLLEAVEEPEARKELVNQVGD